MKNQQRGFTLVEAMVVVTIIALLAATALPSYNEYIRRGHRAEARAALLQAAQWMERAATATGTYPPDDAFPESLEKIPSIRYKISVASPPIGATSGAAFTLTATPQNAQANDKCGNFTLKHTGERSASLPECWMK